MNVLIHKTMYNAITQRLIFLLIQRLTKTAQNSVIKELNKKNQISYICIMFFDKFNDYIYSSAFFFAFNFAFKSLYLFSFAGKITCSVVFV